MGSFRFPPALINSYHALAVLAGVAFLVGLISPGRVGNIGAYSAFLGAPLFLSALAVFTGILGLHVGGAEESWWRERPLPPGRQGLRLAALVGLGLALLLPFLFAFRALTGGSWKGLLLSLPLLGLCGHTWAVVGFHAAAYVKSSGVRFLTVYGALLVVYFAPMFFAFPLSPILAAGELWRGETAGVWGLLLWGGLDLIAAGGWWLWGSKSRSEVSAGGSGSGRGSD